jgi:tripeptidyl-peptidase-2
VSLGRTFDVQVDPRQLPPGAHFTEILAFSSRSQAAGPLFRVPISILVPERFEDQARSGADFEKHSFRMYYPQLQFSTGTIVRKFLAIPTGANMVCIRVKGVSAPSKRRFVLHCLQHDPLCASRDSS